MTAVSVTIRPLDLSRDRLALQNLLGVNNGLDIAVLEDKALLSLRTSRLKR